MIRTIVDKIWGKLYCPSKNLVEKFGWYADDYGYIAFSRFSDSTLNVKILVLVMLSTEMT